MRKSILILISILLLQGCGPIGKNKTEEVMQIITDTSQETLPVSLKNPALMNGSDFLNIFKRFYVNQNYNSMYLFTSDESKIKFGEKNILKFYKQELNLGFTVKLKSLQYKQDSTICMLSYEADIYATKQIKIITCRIENDSAKILLTNLQSIFQ